ncbi:LacI family DNA-binding transcriptional regulator [Paenibacillus sp. YN15]|uniref:LacI family DNA-binding transcriptional regulator n=1 Tax=Paenibacillus sp. YN15 TaxID=1742774 RepID=UPI000DCB2479|nr:LacI family DNA-binding transcriptional regulator [Paenibacillus sp. YN15]RAU98142.1 LacI family transcriptional regulator [Paenibacillus sp. YN15]
MRVTIKDIARELDLGISTVSRALNHNYGVHPDTISLVERKAAELGYVPNLGAKQLVGKKSGLIGIFMPEFDMEATPEHHEFFPPICKAVRELGKDAVIFPVPHARYRQGSLTEWVQQRNLEGGIFMPPFWRNHPLVKEALKLKLPSVNLSDALGPQCSLVRSDDREGGRLAGRLLTEYGHRIIGYIDGPSHLSICQERAAGFREALASEAALLLAQGDFSGTSGAQAALGLLEECPGITAVCCANDLMAMGAITALEKEGRRVPEDISVVGYDGAFFTAYMNPPLTTVCHNTARIAVRAVELLANLLNGGPSQGERITPSLVVRESVRRM